MDNSMYKEVPDKTYKILIKEGCHVNTKTNPDGSVAALQFNDDSNTLSGPLNIIESDEKVPSMNPILELVLREFVIPVARDSFEACCSYFLPIVQEKATEEVKKCGDKAKFYFSAFRDAISGKEPKINQLRREQEDCEQLSERNESSEKEVHSREEIQSVINAMQVCLYEIATCIRWLNNAVMEDDGTDPMKRLEIQKQLETLSAKDVTKWIELLLEDKSLALLDETSLRMLAAFREGNFLVGETTVPIRNYLSH